MMPPIRTALLRTACSAYRLLLAAHPRAFRTRFGNEMEQVFRTQLRAAFERGSMAGSLGLAGSMMGDTLMSILRENYAARTVLGGVCLAVGIVFGLCAGYVDQHNAHETYPTLLVLLIGAFGLGLMQPRAPWRWALIMALFVPFYGPVTTVAVRLTTPDKWAILAVAMIPALIGAYAASVLRRVLGGGVLRSSQP